MSATMWTREEAIALARIIETVCPTYGCHIALTGGLLYKDGTRKDADFLFYRIRQVDEIDKPGLFLALEALGVVEARGFGWCHKATWQGKAIDFFFPEEDGEYPVQSEPDPDHLRDMAREDAEFFKDFVDEPF